MLVRRDADPWVVDPGMTFREWVRRRHAAGAGRPYDDLAYHLTTLFPPVRPHGWLELRVIDALPDDLWPVAVAVVTALVDDPQAPPTRARDATTGLGAPPPAAAARDALRRPRSAPRRRALLRRRRSPPFPGSAPTRPWSTRSTATPTGTSPPAAPRPTTCSTTGTHDGQSADEWSRRVTVTRGRGGHKARIAAELDAGARRSLGLTTDVLDDAELLAQHSPLMSPLVWDLAHVGNYEELWLLRDGGRASSRCAPSSTTSTTPSSTRGPRGPTLPLLEPGRGARLHRPTSGTRSLDALDAQPASTATGRRCWPTASSTGWSSSTSTSTTRRCWPPTSCAGGARLLGRRAAAGAAGGAAGLPGRGARARRGRS